MKTKMLLFLSLPLLSLANLAVAHPGPPHTHVWGDELLHLLPAVALIGLVIWFVRRQSD